MLSRLAPLAQLAGRAGVAGRAGLGSIKRRAVARLSRRRAASAEDMHDFLIVAQHSFVHMQAAWDRADLPALGLMTTEPLLDDLREQLSLRGPGPNCTVVLELRARLLALEDLHEAFVASVEFTGLIREHVGEAAEPFRELWLLADVKASGRGWRLAHVQSLC